MKGVLSETPALLTRMSTQPYLEVACRKDSRTDSRLERSGLIPATVAAGYFSFDELSYAIYESNGQLSTMENPEKETVPPSIPLLIVSSGKVNGQNVLVTGKKEKDFLDFIKLHARSEKEVEVMTVDGNGRVYFKRKNSKFQILKFDTEGFNEW